MNTYPTWLAILSRSAAALLGGYAFTYAATACLARLLPLAPGDAVIVATLASFMFYTAAILWAFASRDALHAWAPLGLSAPLALVGFWPQAMEWLA
ncbi:MULTISPECIES: iron transporter [Pseudomonas]|uniref:Iron transporter n=1 Tax=Pseudomonas guariconensis TaxID=1288410 RepID=A0AAX0VPV2_9PSED|nr:MULTISPECIES: iron transporter [Pseudomonas]MDM9594964.1 iron transporter [Pseudomonas guariconensis]MDM9607795.1 iron transporter [Pseudomonas guariconensis]MDM9612752.1 iron transporter [Pseudomonas guariconensis]PLV12559.1 iron transporter [Pseudomonas guariconensis]PLV20903.1 iron transporter [Pseudomonas guariconensis]